MENKEPKTTITIDIIYDVSNPPPKDALTHVEIDSSDLPKLKRFSKELSKFNPSPAKPVSPDVTEIKGRFDKPQEETGGGFIRASPFVCKGIKRTKNGRSGI